MMLIGQYDSPFVRRVAIALRHYEQEYEHRPWSVWSDGEKLAQYNPLRRVPTLVLEDGTVLHDSWVLLDFIDERAGAERALLPRSGPMRQDGLRIAALATGLADKAVSLYYEPLLREKPSQVWIDRCRQQIGDTLDVLERERAGRSTTYFLEETLSHADIAVACALRFTNEGHPGLFDRARTPSLAAHSDRCEALSLFREISQPLIVKL
jgi:glutathione S-transferase